MDGNPKARQNTPLDQMISSQTPFFLLVLLVISIFLAETVIMLLLQSMFALPVGIQILADALMLVLLLFPVLYWYMFRPMRRMIVELSSTEEKLQSEIVERRATEITLRESEEQLHILSAELLRVQEKERKRVSRELHEEMGVTLAALKLGLRFIARNLRKGQEDLREECEQNLKNLDFLIQSIRRLARELSPSPIEDTGLSAALRRLVDKFAQDCNVESSLDLPDIDHLVSEQAQIHIYRIFQEALGNLQKYSQAAHISIVTSRQNDQISFVLEDDGQPFDLKEKATTVGWTTMFERARMLKGTLDVQRKQDGGSRIVLLVPVSA